MLVPVDLNLLNVDIGHKHELRSYFTFVVNNGRPIISVTRNLLNVDIGHKYELRRYFTFVVNNGRPIISVTQNERKQKLVKNFLARFFAASAFTQT